MCKVTSILQDSTEVPVLAWNVFLDSPSAPFPISRAKEVSNPRAAASIKSAGKMNKKSKTADNS